MFVNCHFAAWSFNSSAFGRVASSVIVKFFVVLDTLFPSSPKWWQILKSYVRESLDSLSNTRWTARLASVRPSAHLGDIKKRLGKLTKNSFPSQTAANIKGLKKYTTSYSCLMASVWFKLLAAIDIRNKIRQKADCALDRFERNLSGLIGEMQNLRVQMFDAICPETSLIAENLGIIVTFPSFRGALRVKWGASTISVKGRFRRDSMPSLYF